MVSKKRILEILLLGCIFSLSLAYGQIESQPPGQEESLITVEGRLALEKHEQEEWFILQGKDSQAYIIVGNLKENLKNSLIELGQNNLVSVTGRCQSHASVISCRNKYGFDSKGDRIVDTQCIPYYNLEVTEVLEAKKSDEEIPPPKRDAEEEKRARELAFAQFKEQGLRQIVEIQGVVSNLNLKSPVKTIEITHRDKDNQLIKSVLLLSPNTTVAKRSLVDEEEPIHLSLNALRKGQEVIVVYSRDELKTEVLYITITKE